MFRDKEKKNTCSALFFYVSDNILNFPDVFFHLHCALQLERDISYTTQKKHVLSHHTALNHVAAVYNKSHHKPYHATLSTAFYTTLNNVSQHFADVRSNDI